MIVFYLELTDNGITIGYADDLAVVVAADDETSLVRLVKKSIRIINNCLLRHKLNFP